MLRRNLIQAAVGAGMLRRAAAAAPKPNILWITCEDLSPVLGCNGDRYSATPNLDRFAAAGTRYDRAYATAPVCSPARSCLISGMYAHSLGSMHLRGMVRKPDAVRCFPELLREAGYYTSNNEKEDYNFDRPPGCWDESSGTAHWRKRASGQPFFSVFNIMATHQGEMRYGADELARRNAALPPELRHDPARAPLPPYYPDTPAVRGQIAALYTQVTLMDQRVGQVLRELEEDGLARDTVVFFFSDHGTGLPRGKRFLHDTGLRAPMIVRIPGQAPSVSGRLVSFVDFAPTVLSLAGVPAPSYMQGSAFLGTHARPERTVAFGARDRVDEEIEMSRTAFDGRWQYIRNYMPHRPVLQHGTYSEVAAVWAELRRLHADGKLKGHETLLMADRKPAEELYDRDADPWQLRNLAGSKAHAAIQERLKSEMRRWMISIRDKGLVPEPEMRARAGSGPTAEIAFPVERTLAAAEGRADANDAEPACRYWAANALLNGGYSGPLAMKLSKDPDASVRIVASEALCRNGRAKEGMAGLIEALGSTDACVQLAAAAALWHLGPPASQAAPALRAALGKKTTPEYQRTYFEWAAEKTLKKYG
jgi:N-sulfoglucosamine sulfohydrolase